MELHNGHFYHLCYPIFLLINSHKYIQLYYLILICSFSFQSVTNILLGISVCYVSILSGNLLARQCDTVCVKVAISGPSGCFDQHVHFRENGQCFKKVMCQMWWPQGLLWSAATPDAALISQMLNVRNGFLSMKSEAS